MLQMEMGNRSSLDQLYINIRWLKEWKRSSIAGLGGGILPYSTLWLVLSGSAVLKFGQTVCQIGQNDIISLPSQSYHRWISVSSDTPFHYLSLACEARVGTFDFLRLYSFPLHITMFDKTVFGKLVELWYQLSAEFQSLLRHFNRYELKSSDPQDEPRPSEYPVFHFDTQQTIQYLKIRSLGNLWFHYLLETLQDQLPDSPNLYDTRVYEVCDYINEHLHERPTLEQLARLVSLSKEHLRFLFQKEIGQAPMKFAANMRLQRARELLLLSSSPMKEIAERLGFQNQHLFTRSFHQAEGLSPSNYRRRYKSNIEHPISSGREELCEQDLRKF
ncbi:helix-turn-helix domain-containing protein [Paenibacillus sp. TAB 01]|uniref:helix-turn-helix domain-containing protein n=1 Tax=Paenibacillus sp. TAB 01 TaxID=3368988 RepID=UPI0037507761